MLNGAAPAFVPDGGSFLALARGLFDAALFSVFGGLLFWTSVLPRVRGRMTADTAALVDARLRTLARGSLAAAAILAFAWMTVQAGAMAGAAAGADDAILLRTAVATVATGTRFGHLLVSQEGLLLLSTLALGHARTERRRRVATLAAAAALLLQAGHSHALSMWTGSIWTGSAEIELGLLLLSAGVHLLAGAAWLGGLLPLLLVARAAPPRAAAMAARWFSPLGQWCVGLMACTALFQSWVLVGSVPALLGTAYGWMACIKLVLFSVLVALAWGNRYRFAPALLGARPSLARRRLSASIALQTVAGILVVSAAGLLSSLPPGMHTLPVWPFTQQPSLVTLREDPDFRLEVGLACVALAVALGLAVCGGILFRSRKRLAVLAAACIVAMLAAPHFDLLFVEAYPTSFYTSPTGFSTAAIEQGAALYPLHCAACHGVDGGGHGPAAASLSIPPADLTSPDLGMHTDGELYWWLSHGIDAPRGGLAMPGFGAVLSADQLWALIDFIHAHNAGRQKRQAGDELPRVQAPSFQATCSDGRVITLADLRGRVVRLAIGTAPRLDDRTLATVRVDPDPAALADAGDCIASDETVARAYGIAAGLLAEPSRGVTFLIDANGWLRAMQTPLPGAGRQEIMLLLDKVRQLRAHPIALPAGMNPAHMRM